MSIKNDGHYFCRAGGNRPDGLNEPVTDVSCLGAHLRSIPKAMFSTIAYDFTSCIVVHRTSHQFRLPGYPAGMRRDRAP
ncbi:hypothetical protein E0L12_27135 [Escherichia coli]|nr:hypothetical protein E0L12_27135 [Escherichia coli]